jgi:hypothetical protein
LKENYGLTQTISEAGTNTPRDLIMIFRSLSHRLLNLFYFMKQSIALSKNLFEKLIVSHTVKKSEDYPEEKIIILHSEAYFNGPYSQPEK